MSKWDYIKAISEYDRTVNKEKYGTLLVKLMERYGKKSTMEITEDEVRDFYNQEILKRRD